MSLSGDINKFILRLDKATDETIKAVELELFSSVILDSPVDTGRFRGNWQTSFNVPINGIIDDIDQSGEGSINKANSVINSRDGPRKTHLVNNLPYAVRLEYGYSQQAPDGMVRKNTNRLQQIVDDKANAHKL